MVCAFRTLPVSAYTSFALGAVAEWQLPELVRLHSSRGFESYEGKVRDRVTCSTLGQ